LSQYITANKIVTIDIWFLMS